MDLPIKLISTDFDGTLHTEDEHPRIPLALSQLLAKCQAEGISWAINTGRSLPHLDEGLARAGVPLRPDYAIVVEREIYRRTPSGWEAFAEWNDGCTAAHKDVYARSAQILLHARLILDEENVATVYADEYSPLCWIASHSESSVRIHTRLDALFAGKSGLAVMRNDIYARLSHPDYHKGSALGELSRHLGIHADQVVAAGDHVNDLSMLSHRYARWLIAPSNAVAEVKETVARQAGVLSPHPCGHGVEHGLRTILAAQNKINAGAHIKSGALT